MIWWTLSLPFLPSSLVVVLVVFYFSETVSDSDSQVSSTRRTSLKRRKRFPSSFEALAPFTGRYASGTLELYMTSSLLEGKDKQKRKICILNWHKEGLITNIRLTKQGESLPHPSRRLLCVSVLVTVTVSYLEVNKDSRSWVCCSPLNWNLPGYPGQCDNDNKSVLSSSLQEEEEVYVCICACVCVLCVFSSAV
jgi:hypothetical protein